MKTLKVSLTFLICICVLTLASKAKAVGFPRFMASYRNTTYLGGEKAHSFSESKSIGVGGGLTLLFDTPKYAPFIGVHYSTLNGKQSFSDNGNLVSSVFTLQSITGEAGINYYFSERSGAGLNFFATAAGIVGQQSIKLSQTIDFERLPRSSSGYSTGGRIGAGFDWSISNKSFSTKRRWTITGEVSYKIEPTLLMKQNFSLDGVVAAFGLSW